MLEPSLTSENQFLNSGDGVPYPLCGWGQLLYWGHLCLYLWSHILCPQVNIETQTAQLSQALSFDCALFFTTSIHSPTLSYCHFWSAHLIPVLIHGLNIWGADSHSCCFTFSHEPLQCAPNVMAVKMPTDPHLDKKTRMRPWESDAMSTWLDTWLIM